MRKFNHFAQSFTPSIFMKITVEPIGDCVAIDFSQSNTLRDCVVETVSQMHGLLTETSISVGAKTAVLDNLRESLDEIKFNTETESTYLEEADIAQVAIDLSRQQVLYEMSLAVVGKILSLSLLDFIR